MLAQTTYGLWLPPDLSEHGGKIDNLIDIVHVFMAVLFIAWGIFFVYCLMKYRAGDGHKARYEPVKGTISKYGEIGVGIFEAFVLLVLSMPVWADYKNNPPAEDARLPIRVISKQFEWNFHYAGKDNKFGSTDSALITASNPIGLVAEGDGADDIVTVNEFHIPTGRPIYLRLTSMDVIHSFAIPTMRVKQDIIPGLEIPIWFEAKEGAESDKIREQMKQKFPISGASWYKLRHMIACEDHRTAGGEVLLAKGADLGDTLQKGEDLIAQLRKAGITELYMTPRSPLEVVCAQLCGNSHFKMKATMTVHDAAGFTGWIEEKSKAVEFEDF